MDVLEALVTELRDAGGHVLEGRRGVKVSKGGDLTATLDDETTVRGHTVVLATGNPVLARGPYFAKVEPMRSYALAFAHPDPTELMMMAAGSPSRSIRDTPTSRPATGAKGAARTTARLLLVGR